MCLSSIISSDPVRARHYTPETARTVPIRKKAFCSPERRPLVHSFAPLPRSPRKSEKADTLKKQQQGRLPGVVSQPALMAIAELHPLARWRSFQTAPFHKTPMSQRNALSMKP
jgi:hypothetical protein